MQNQMIQSIRCLKQEIRYWFVLTESYKYHQHYQYYNMYFRLPRAQQKKEGGGGGGGGGD